jgi:crotonobetaine/carnitine-CoA ligase
VPSSSEPPPRSGLALQAFADRTVPDLLDRSRQFGPDRPIALTISPAATLSYGEFLDRVAGTAAELSAHFPPGARVACLLANTLDYLILRYALSCAGLVEVAVNGEHKGSVLRHMLEITRPQAVILADRHRDNLVACEFGLGTVKVIDEQSLARMTGTRIGWEKRPKVGIGPRDPSRILFTSGTSGLSKAVELSHAYEVYTGERHLELIDIGVSDRWLYVTPLFHIDAIYIFSILLHSGGALGLAPNFSASRFWSDVETTEASYLCYVGSILAILLKHKPPDKPTPLRLAVGGGATREDIARFEQMSGARVLESYALTEAIACTFNTIRDDRPGSVGRPVPGYEVAILGDAGEPLSSGIVGEIAVRASEPCALFTRYFGDEKSTAEAMRGGWFHTGDLGMRDADGYVYFRGRIKDAIRVRGENVSARELEAIAESHPGIAASAAIAVPAELGDDDILLYVEPKTGTGLKGEDLFTFLAARAAKFMLPRYIRFIASFPRTPTQKIRKSELRREIDGDTWMQPDARSDVTNPN